MERKICHHCNKEISISIDSKKIINETSINKDEKSLNYFIEYFLCPLCGNPTIYLTSTITPDFGAFGGFENHVIKSKERYVGEILQAKEIYPIFHKHKDFNHYIPQIYVDDYNEACDVLSVSAKACAILCRRLCEILLRDVAKCTKYRLESKIDEFIENNNPPSPLVDYLPYLKLAGDTVAHSKDDNSGTKLNIEKADCEILLETVELLFDFLFIQPKLKDEKLQKLKKFDDSKSNKT